MADKVSDPHPSDENHYDEQGRPGGSKPPKHGVEPNDAIHDGHQHPKGEIADKSGYRK